jgi:hypothetical protein
LDKSRVAILERKGNKEAMKQVKRINGKWWHRVFCVLIYASCFLNIVIFE